MSKEKLLLLHVYRPFIRQLIWLYDYADSGKPFAHVAEWIGDRLDDLAIGWTKLRYWIWKRRQAKETP